MKSILDKDFRYTPSHATDIRKLFARVRGELRQVASERIQKVTPLKKNVKSS